MSEHSVDFPREYDSQRSHQEPDLGSDDRRRDCGDRNLEEAHPLTGNGVRHALDSRGCPGRCLYLNRRPMGCPVIDNIVQCPAVWPPTSPAGVVIRTAGGVIVGVDLGVECSAPQTCAGDGLVSTCGDPAADGRPVDVLRPD